MSKIFYRNYYHIKTTCRATSPCPIPIRGALPGSDRLLLLHLFITHIVARFGNRTHILHTFRSKYLVLASFEVFIILDSIHPQALIQSLKQRLQSLNNIKTDERESPQEA